MGALFYSARRGFVTLNWICTCSVRKKKPKTPTPNLRQAAYSFLIFLFFLFVSDLPFYQFLPPPHLLLSFPLPPFLLKEGDSSLVVLLVSWETVEAAKNLSTLTDFSFQNLLYFSWQKILKQKIFCCLGASLDLEPGKSIRNMPALE